MEHTAGDDGESVAAALATHATPLGTTDPLAAFPNPAGLDTALGNARIVGLGEATHGTRDIFRLKHRLIRYLVVEHDLRVVALEANAPETLAIDEYVVHGRGDPREALAGIYFWTWNVEAVLDLLVWLREFNEGRPLADRVRFHGLDIQYTTGAVSRLRSYFETVDAALPDRFEADLDAVDDGGTNPDRGDQVEKRREAAERVAAAVRERLDEHRETYIARAGERAWHLARRHATIIERATAYRQARADYRRSAETDGEGEEAGPETVERLLRIRDRAMADSVEWLLEFEDADHIALWGHDAHINRSKHAVRGRAIATTPMGGYLAERHGSDYLAVGFSVGGGSFQALVESEADGERTYELQAHTLDGPPGAVDATLANIGESPFLLDIRAAAGDKRLTDWLATPRATFSAGATYDPDSPEQYTTEYRLGEAFDAICYVDGTGRARPIERA